MNSMIEATVRPFSMDYLDEVVELINRSEQKISQRNMLTAEDLKPELETPGFNPQTDIALFFTPGGKLAAYAEIWDLAEPHVRPVCFGRVDPDFEGQGFGTQMMRWFEMRAQTSLVLAPPDARVVIHNRARSTHREALDLFRGQGYAHVRSSYRMLIEFDSPPDPANVPAGIEIRPIRPGTDDLYLAILADYEAFKDHWGFLPEPFEKFYERVKHWIDNDPDMDLSTCFLAMEGEEVAGMCFNSLVLTQYPDRGWVNSLGVRRAWRKRGIGLALLRTSFAELYRRGRKAVGLGVDAQNLTGALRLYLNAGMRIDEESHIYEKELRPGKDLMVTG